MVLCFVAVQNRLFRLCCEHVGREVSCDVFVLGAEKWLCCEQLFLEMAVLCYSWAPIGVEPVCAWALRLRKLCVEKVFFASC